MRAVIAGLTLVFVSSAAFAQQAAAPSAAPGRTMVSAADVSALIAKARVDRKRDRRHRGADVAAPSARAEAGQRAVGTRWFNSSNQFRTTIREAGVAAGSLVTGGSLIIRNFWSSREMSYTRGVKLP